ncbi:hypothetical protein HFO42_07560 [Rhizobium leguminosarum]|uniref:Ankyrin repeat domain-containing protein n=1 Tax=Rhizobium leguminosarum TaxID=384 RepID=A0AAJ1A639_RHILE|nr:hypothetical protein [Rhizobium leguminosarum]MBY5532827.1 hypothetical protein [Rhizobium leguminosarum]MBY5594295.1 hypothetical protein [Rhizobium leguminosarum]MBY5627972.1 hypothetical protein [Rhizobium leguminosarum]
MKFFLTLVASVLLLASTEQRSIGADAVRPIFPSQCGQPDLREQHACYLATSILRKDYAEMRYILENPELYAYVRINSPSVAECGHGPFIGCTFSNRYIDLEALRILIEFGADLNVRRGEYSYIFTVLQLRNRLEAMDLFLQNGADPNVRLPNLPVSSRYRSFPSPLLWQAVLFCNQPDGRAVIDLLLANGADPLIKLEGDVNYLHWEISNVTTGVRIHPCVWPMAERFIQADARLATERDRRGWLPIDYIGNKSMGGMSMEEVRHQCKYRTDKRRRLRTWEQALIAFGSPAGRRFSDEQVIRCSVGDAKRTYRLG